MVCRSTLKIRITPYWLVLALLLAGVVSSVRADIPVSLAPPMVQPSADRAYPSDAPDTAVALPLPFEARPPALALPRWEFLPAEPLLWQPPLASLRQPRMFVIADSLDNASTSETINTAIGATVGLFRFRPCRWPHVEFEVDFFGVHFSRWSERHLAIAGDYRFGFPVTFRSGPWQGKVGYEHTSTHLGDDFIEISGQRKVQYVRDELVLGLAYRWWNQLRVYGELGIAVYLGSVYERSPERFNWGIEWSRQEPTGWKGQPFAAFDMDLRPEQNYDPNMSLQLGWQWIPVNQRTSGRLALQLYDGRSPYGQFITAREQWYGIGVFIDF